MIRMQLLLDLVGSGQPIGRSGAYIIADIVHLIDKLQRGQRIQVEIRWIPAHIGVPGNELVDTAAKEAAGWTAKGGGLQTTGNTILAKTYPLQATLKTWIKQEVKMEWNHSWKTESRGRASYRHMPEPTHKILKLHQGRRKWQSAMLVQMRTEKIGLRDFL